MTDETRGTGGPAKTRTASHFMKPTVAAELLRAQHGEENARKIALQEQQRARRARSRRRFEFWDAVVAQIERDITTLSAEGTSEASEASYEGSIPFARENS